MKIPLDELVRHFSIVGLLAMAPPIIARPLSFCRKWLPLFWNGRGATRAVRLHTDPMEVDITQLPQRGLVQRLYEWTAEARSGRTRLGFDDWLTGMALPGELAAGGIAVQQNDLKFLLRHGSRYVVTDPSRGVRVFECRIDGRLPIVAFVDAMGRRGPWLTLPKLLTIEEIVSLKPLASL